MAPALEDRLGSRMDGLAGGEVQWHGEGFAASPFDPCDDGVGLRALLAVGDGDPRPFATEQHGGRGADAL